MQKKPALVAGAAALLAFAVGTGVGASGKPAKATPEPVPTVTATATVTSPPRTVEKRVEVPTTPTACLQALDLADSGFRNASDGFSAVGTIFEGLQVGDYSVFGSQNKVLQGVLKKQQALVPEYKAAKEACRNGKVS